MNNSNTVVLLLWGGGISWCLDSVAEQARRQSSAPDTFRGAAYAGDARRKSTSERDPCAGGRGWSWPAQLLLIVWPQTRLSAAGRSTPLRRQICGSESTASAEAEFYIVRKFSDKV